MDDHDAKDIPVIIRIEPLISVLIFFQPAKIKLKLKIKDFGQRIN